MIKLLSFFSLVLVCLFGNTSFPHKLESLEGTLCTCSDFIEEDRRRVAATTPTTLAQHIALQSHQQGLETLQSWVDTMFSRIEDVKNQRCTLDVFLCEQLTTRLDSLKSRTEGVISSLVPEEGRRIGAKVVPTDPDLFRRHFLAESRELNEAGLQITMQEWEYKQLVIKHTFFALEAEGGMSAKTRTMLQLSPSLWPLLQYQTYDLGHPDQVGGYGSFVWIMDHDHRLQEAAAAEIYRMSVIEPQKEFAGSLGKVYTREILPHLDGDLYRAYTDRSIERTFPDLMLGGKGRTFTLTLTPLEAEVWGDPLRQPDFLFKVRKEPQSATTLAPVPSALKPTLAPSSSKERKKEPAPTSPPTEKVGVPAVQPVVVSLPVVPEKEPEEHSPLDEELNEPAGPVFAAPGSIGIAALAQRKEFVWPRGIRLSRPDILEKPITLVAEPDKRVQEFVDELFDEARLSHIRFSDFQKNWERIGGRVEGTRGGGSHRHLIAPDGTPLWGTFDHGGFGSQTIGYLQAAFWSQGYRPEK